MSEDRTIDLSYCLVILKELLEKDLDDDDKFIVLSLLDKYEKELNSLRKDLH